MREYIDLLDTIVWPVTVLVIFWFLRRELALAVRRLTSLSYRDLSAQFETGLSQVKSDLKSIQDDSGEPAHAEELGKHAVRYERLLQLAEISPRAAITESWRDIEIATKTLAEATDIAVGGRIAGVKAIRQLVSRGMLPSSVIGVYEKLRRLRAKAAHAEEFSIEIDEAQDYVDTAHSFYITLEFLIEKTSHDKSGSDPSHEG